MWQQLCCPLAITTQIAWHWGTRHRREEGTKRTLYEFAASDTHKYTYAKVEMHVCVVVLICLPYELIHFDILIMQLSYTVASVAHAASYPAAERPYYSISPHLAMWATR